MQCLTLWRLARVSVATAKGALRLFLQRSENARAAEKVAADGQYKRLTDFLGRDEILGFFENVYNGRDAPQADFEKCAAPLAELLQECAPPTLRGGGRKRRPPWPGDAHCPPGAAWGGTEETPPPDPAARKRRPPSGYCQK